MNFVSSDDPNVDIRPKIDICLSNVINSTTTIPDEVPLLKAYPNPSSQDIQINHLLNKVNTFELINSRGQVIYQAENIADNFSFQVSAYPKGIYFIHLSDKQTQLTEKIVIQ